MKKQFSNQDLKKLIIPLFLEQLLVALAGGKTFASLADQNLTLKDLENYPLISQRREHDPEPPEVRCILSVPDLRIFRLCKSENIFRKMPVKCLHGGQIAGILRTVPQKSFPDVTFP